MIGKSIFRTQSFTSKRIDESERKKFAPKVFLKHIVLSKQTHNLINKNNRQTNNIMTGQSQ